MLLRVILDDLHGDNADAVNAPAAGADYPVLAVRPASFPDWVVAYAKRASPHAFDLSPADAGTKRKQATEEEPKRTKKPKKDSAAKAAKKKTRRVRHDSSSSESSDIAGINCVTCRGPRTKGTCDDSSCLRDTIHTDLRKALAAKSL